MTGSLPKILFIGHSGYQYPHTRVRCYNFARELARRGLQTQVLSFRDHLTPRHSEQDMYFTLRDRDKLALNARCLARLLRERGTLFYLQKIHFHAAAPYWLGRLGLNRYIVDYDDYDIPLSNFCQRGRWNRLLFGSTNYDRITQQVVRHAAGCVASSHALVDFLRQYHDQVWYVPTGVDTDIFFPGDQSPDRQEVVLYWNGLVWGDPILENLVFILNVFREAHALNNRLVLRIQGDGKVWHELQALVRDQYSDLPIQLRGWVAPEAMADQLRQVDIGLLPLVKRDDWTRAKSPTKLFEYLASGLAVVAHTTGEVNHVIQHGENGWLADDGGAFREGILALATDADLRRRMGQAARARVLEHYALPRLGDSLEAMLRQLTGGG